MIVLPKKDPAEIIPVGFDFSSEIEPGESITGVYQTLITIYSGTDANPADMIFGAPQIDGNIVYLPITGGTLYAFYLIKVVVNTSNAYKRLARIAALPIGIN